MYSSLSRQFTQLDQETKVFVDQIGEELKYAYDTIISK